MGSRGIAVLAVVAVATTAVACSSISPTRSSPDVSTRPSRAAPANSELRAALGAYRQWVAARMRALARATADVTRAVDRHAAADARRLYPAARRAYESVEPTAEIWGTLDLQIDGRANDFIAPQPFTGFHRLELGLWSRPTDPALPAVADALLARVRRLQTLAVGVSYTTLELTHGATELLDEVQANKITGEEERYSHLDLLDFAANVDGVREGVTVLRTFLATHNAALLATIDKRMKLVGAALARFAARPGYDGSGYVRYTTVSAADRRKLAGAVQGLAEPVSLLTQVTSE